MAAKEKDVYREFSIDFKSQTGGRCEKMSDRHVAGRPDLYTSCKKYGVCWIEVKFEVAPKREDTAIKLNLSGPQRNWIKEEQRCGGNAGWMICVKFGPREWRYYVGTDPNTQRVCQSTHVCTRKSGEALDVKKVMSRLVR